MRCQCQLFQRCWQLVTAYVERRQVRIGVLGCQPEEGEQAPVDIRHWGDFYSIGR